MDVLEGYTEDRDWFNR